MLRKTHYQDNQSALILIPSPLGNLEDITLRAIRTLKEVPLLYAEDTRVTRILLQHLGIERQMMSLHDHNETEMTADIIRHLQSGNSVGLISDQGMPLISDPGHYLVRHVQEAGFPVVCLPGPSAGLTALVMSGLAPHPHLFFGFLNANKGKRTTELAQLQYRKETLIFYEAPHRIQALMADMAACFPRRKVVVVREISKKFEEVIFGTPEELQALSDLKGEIVVVVEGYQESGSDQTVNETSKWVEHEIAQGLSEKDAIRKVAQLTGIAKNKIYSEYLENKKQQ
jgi:16S rRNA (cytidine1402-2'-O)-methyltransferase